MPEGDVGTQALQLQAIVSNLIWVVGIEPKSSARTVRILKPLSTSSVLLIPHNKALLKGTSCQLPFHEPATSFIIYLPSRCSVTGVHSQLPSNLCMRRVPDKPKNSKSQNPWVSEWTTFPRGLLSHYSRTSSSEPP